MASADIQLEHSSLIVPAVKILKYRIHCLVQTLTIQSSEATFRKFSSRYLNLLPNAHCSNSVPKPSTQSCSFELYFLGLTHQVATPTHCE